MRIRWTLPAAEDLESIRRYLELNHPQYAESTGRTIYRRVKALKTHPHRGRPGHKMGTRELTLAPLPFVVVYTVDGDALQIVHIYHGAQDWQ